MKYSTLILSLLISWSAINAQTNSDIQDIAKVDTIILFDGCEAQISGLKGTCTIEMGTIAPSSREQQDVSLLYSAINKQNGKVLPFIRIVQNNRTQDPEQQGGYKCDDGRDAISIVLVYKKAKRNVMGFLSKSNGDYEWIPPENNPTKKSKRIEFLIPHPEEMESDVNISNWKFGDSQSTIFRPIHFEELKLPKEDDPLFRSHHFQECIKDENGGWMFKKIEGEALKNKLDSFGDKPSLLLLHGTNGTPEIAFNQLINSNEMDSLLVVYEDRVIAFSHPSIRVGVCKNVKKFRKILKKSNANPFSNLDILTRSRGCLVARFLMERKNFLKKNYVNKLVMLSGPNQGTHSSTGFSNQWRAFTKITPILNNLPPQPEIAKAYKLEQDIYEMIELLLIRGIADQALKSKLLKCLDKKIKYELPDYYAISTEINLDTSCWEQRDWEQIERLTNLLEKTFNEIVNDGLIPTESAFGKLEGEFGAKYFNLASYYILTNSPQTHHLSYMESKELRQVIVNYLRGKNPPELENNTCPPTN